MSCRARCAGEHVCSSSDIRARLAGFLASAKTPDGTKWSGSSFPVFTAVFLLSALARDVLALSANELELAGSGIQEVWTLCENFFFGWPVRTKGRS